MQPRSSRAVIAAALAGFSFLFAAIAGPGSVTARPWDREVPNFTETTPESKERVERGLKFLADQQALSKDGSLGEEYKVAITSLACLSWMAHGNTPGRGVYGENVRKGLKYILHCASKNKSGFITEEGFSKSRMHGHGYATLFLAEVYGMTGTMSAAENKRVRDTLRNAVEIIVASQTGRGGKIGGWGYEPSNQIPDESSVTVTAIQALRAARNAGIYVDAKVIDRAIEYVKACYDPSDGSFRYSLAMNNPQSSFALTAAAISVLVYAGEYEAEEIQGGLKYMRNEVKSRGRSRSGHYFYEVFYATLASYNVGGADWQTWFPRIREELVRSQRPDGSWQNEYCAAYGTAFATLILQVPTRYLPIFQR